MNPHFRADEDSVTHVVYHPETGRVLGTMRHDRERRHDHPHGGGEQGDEIGEVDEAGDRAAGGAAGHAGACSCGDDEATLGGFLAEDAHPGVLPRLLDAPPELAADLRALRVDVASGRLEPLPHLVIDPARTVLDGNGQDTVAIEIRVVDAHGAVVEGFSGDVHVQAGRGRLSERGGNVRVERGRATIQLTSVAETVDAVPLVATAVQGGAAVARASLAFQ